MTDLRTKAQRHPGTQARLFSSPSTWLALASLGATAGFALANVSGCGGCVRENRATSASVEPAQSCLQLDIAHDQSGVLMCGDGLTVGGVNNCADTLWILVRPSGFDGGSTDAGGSTDGGSTGPLGPDAQSFPPSSSINFGLSTVDARQDADGTFHWDLPAALGSQSLVVHLSMGPKK